MTVPLMLAALSVALPIWVHNGYNFYQAPVLEYHATRAWEQQARRGRTKEVNFAYLFVFFFLNQFLVHFIMLLN